MSVAVVGAGPAGLTAAYVLAKAGTDVEVFESGESVGGLARSFKLWGQTVDLGPHRFFSTDARVNRLWLEIVGRDYQMVDRLTRIYYRGRFFRYPLSAGNALWNLGPMDAARCLLSYLAERARASAAETEGNFEDWVTRRFGRRLFETFFKAYSEKLWGISCRELDADFAAQRIKKLSLGEAIKNALKIGGGQHRTLVDRFAYPLGGTGMVYERMAECVAAVGKLHLNSPVRRIVRDGNRIAGLELEHGQTRQFDYVISTMPLTLLVQGLQDAPADVRSAAKQLTFRNTILVYLHVEGGDLFPDQWLYIHSPELLTGRVTNFRNWVPQLYGAAPNTILALEFWCYDHDPLWRESDAQLIERATAEIRSTGLTGAARILDGHVVRVRRCYPVYARGYREPLAKIQSYLNQLKQLTVIGRYGAFKYNNQDHSILMGLLAAQNLLEATGHNLWSVNTDYDSYQEAARIDEVGLVPASA
jgi:protoporphyrinogen oxidase